MKSSLVLTGIVITDDHWVSERFLKSFPLIYDANDAYKKALGILDAIIRFLKEKHNISFRDFP